MTYIVSACLLGENCKYNGKNNDNSGVKKFCCGNRIITICPEAEGGLGTPRAPAEIAGGSGENVLDGTARVINSEGKDVTEFFVNGAKLSLEKIIRESGEDEKLTAVLKSGSPSCGSGIIYDGSFSKTQMTGDGVMAALLKRKGIEVITEEDIQER